MRHFKYIIVSAITLLILSCTDWLDIQPQTEIKQDKLFESESGFKDALIGCYMLMGDSTLYGRELTYTFMDVLAQQYDLFATTNPYNSAMQYSYATSVVEKNISNIWSNMYHIIANLNSILENIELKKEILHPTNYAIIKAEALGLRAHLHFDLLRMFGWGNLVNTPGNLDKLSIPYVTHFSKELTKQSSVREVLSYVHKDLKTAEELLAYYDVFNQVAQDEDYELPNDDNFYKNRMCRFNYYAVRATQARVYMWEGKYQEALERVSLFVDNQPIKWVNLLESVLNPELTKKDFIFTIEHIFYLDINKMYGPLKPYIEQYQIVKDFSVSENTKYFYHSSTDMKVLYETETGGNEDQRYNTLIDKNDAAHNLFMKFKEVPDSKSPGKNRMPLIKKPEMFYYAAECYNRTNERKKAIELLNEVRNARGIDKSHNLPETLTTEEIDQEILKEWKKEYIGEGQMFYYYKRLGLQIPNATSSGDALFILPLPQKEVEIGGREDYQKD